MQIEEQSLTRVSVIVPAYNEESAIVQTIEHLRQTLRGTDLDFEIIVVDDGSTDRTAERIDSVDGIRVVRHPWNMGYGAAIKSGIRHSEGKVIAIIDSDGTYPIDAIPILFKESESFDMVVGARTGDHVRISLMRKPAKWFLNKMANYLTGIEIPDLNSGLRVFTKEAVSRYLNLLPARFSFTTTITLAFLSDGYTVKYIPINYFDRVGKSKIRPIRDTWNFIILIFRTALYFGPLKVFVPLGFLLGIIATLWGVASTFIFGKVSVVSVVLLGMLGVQSIFLGLIGDLIVRRTYPGPKK